MMKLKGFTSVKKTDKSTMEDTKKKRKKPKKNPKEMDLLRDTFLFQEIYPSGICRLDETTYSVTIELNDINYQLSSEDSQIEIFSQYCDFLNSLSSKTKLQLTVYKKKRPLADLQSILYYQEKMIF